MEKGVIGIDIGGTNTVIGIFNHELELLDKVSIPTLKPYFPKKTSNPEEFFDLIEVEVSALAEKNDYKNKIKCVGIGVPGKVNPNKGIVIRAVNLGYEEVPFASEMEKRLGVPVFIDNDVRNYARGEALAGSGKGADNLICITLGTGMAAAVMINGQMVTGSDYYAGELGHDPVPGANYLCNCGKIGCLETIASASGISRLAQEAIQSGDQTILKSNDGTITSKDVYLACLQNDQVALGIFDYVGKTLAEKLLTATFLLNPEAIIIGGGAASAGKFILEPIQDIFVQHYDNSELPKLVIGSLGDSAGLIGSAHLAVAEFEQNNN
ncbi:ROK family protein [Bacillus sp. FJAT-49732]|uniref:ROK family protein n=1 Tax=Lederbergia citrisecunda TaxID=2833583 RepID=A0A942TLP0_9BACI|nr:ROK family protein [Lederbergia citrisecunda]MBS4199885.1 ROK family protein [Lederbergia citrisecunda]